MAQTRTLPIEGLNMSKRSFLLKVLSKSGFKDVYWVAILCFYGVLGLGFFALIFYQLFRAALNLYKRSVRTSSVIGQVCLHFALDPAGCNHHALPRRCYRILCFFLIEPLNIEATVFTSGSVPVLCSPVIGHYQPIDL